jgi:hypothetical protein
MIAFRLFVRLKQRQYLQTSVVMPASMICFLPVALTASRNWGLSQASTSPWRAMSGAFGYLAQLHVNVCQSFNGLQSYMSRIALGRGPFGPSWAEVDNTTGKSNSFPMAACAIMAL